MLSTQEGLGRKTNQKRTMRESRKKILSIVLPFLLRGVTTFHYSREVKAFRWTALSQNSCPDAEISLSNHQDKQYTSLPRLYIGPLPTCQSLSTIALSVGTKIILSPAQAHYVTKVMRLGGKKQAFNKNLIRIFDGSHGEWLSEVIVEDAMDRKRKRQADESVSAKCLQQLRPQPISHLEPWLYLAPLKKVRIKMILEKCTELGVGGFTIIATDRTDPGSERDCQDVEKLAMQIIEACEQCERLNIPTLLPLADGITVKSLLDEFKESAHNLLICRERSNASPVLNVLEKLDKQHSRISFLVGPEGGWSQEEENIFDSYFSKSICGVSLGSSVLRAETAAMTVVAAYTLRRDCN